MFSSLASRPATWSHGELSPLPEPGPRGRAGVAAWGLPCVSAQTREHATRLLPLPRGVSHTASAQPCTPPKDARLAASS